MIELKNIYKTFYEKSSKVEALKDVSLSVEKGDIYGVIGFSGAGKSTLIRMVNSLEKPDSGQVVINGIDINKISKAELLKQRRKIGMVFQQFNLLEAKNVYENVAIPLKLAGVKEEEIRKRVRELLDFVELSDKEKTYISKLSGGQKQRVGIARALANNPDILLCDEATSALDPKTTEAILELLKRVNEKFGITILLITHQMEVIQKICNKVAVMENGRIIEEGRVLEVFTRPSSPVTKDFVKSVISDSVPSSIVELVKKDKRNARVEKLNFVGESINEALISNISKTEGIEINILCANVKELRDGVICLFIIRLIGEDKLIDSIEEKMDKLGIIRERVLI